MNIKLFNIALGIVLTLITVSASAQKLYTEGVVTSNTSMQGNPVETFVKSAETKQISGFNCKKVVATDAKTNKAYEVWITNDVSVSPNAVAPYYAGIGGFPIQFTSFGGDGQQSDVTVTGITDTKAPAGTFGISADFDKITMSDLKAMSGGN